MARLIDLISVNSRTQHSGPMEETPGSISTNGYLVLLLTERFAINYYKEERQYREPIKAQSNYMHVADAKRGKTHASETPLALVLLLIGRKNDANYSSQRCSVVDAKLIFASTLKRKLLQVFT